MSVGMGRDIGVWRFVFWYENMIPKSGHFGNEIGVLRERGLLSEGIET